MLSPSAATAPPQSTHASARGGDEFVDLAVSLSLSRKTVPFGGTLREVVRVTNRGTERWPATVFGRRWHATFGQEINKPGRPHDRGKGIYAFARSPGGRCSHGTFGGGSRIQTFACDVTPLAPGESQAAVVKIKNIEGPLLLDAKVVLFDGTIRTYDDRRANDAAQAVVRVRRR